MSHVMKLEKYSRLEQDGMEHVGFTSTFTNKIFLVKYYRSQGKVIPHATAEDSKYKFKSL
jgi:hypothetical protein